MSLRAFHETIEDMLSRYELRRGELLLVHDLHPEYCSITQAGKLGIPNICAVQHHRAHLASVIAEHGEWTKRVTGVSFDGPGYGDDGTFGEARFLQEVLRMVFSAELTCVRQRWLAETQPRDFLAAQLSKGGLSGRPNLIAR
ncbi:MAG TPA: hypothetical protein VNO32_25840 [Candidatus Acidoferrum sp.]|nr:hypothetical protein [Candidatus Acidoferrum sp.]